MDVWQRSMLEPARTYGWAVGPLQLWLRSARDELQVVVERSDETTEAARAASLAPVADMPIDLEWARWIVREGAQLQFVPAMPDRAVVARPESPVGLPSGTTALFYVSIPVWVRLVSHAGEPVTLTEVPSKVLSNIWFGDTMTGELCYSLTTRARREIRETPAQPHRAVCPVNVRNASEEALDIQRLHVHTTHLTVYRAGSRLWTNEATVTLHGADDGCRAEFREGPPRQAAGAATVLCEPRQRPRPRLWGRAFETFKSLI